jgi:hypothetical protein
MGIYPDWLGECTGDNTITLIVEKLGVTIQQLENIDTTVSVIDMVECELENKEKMMVSLEINQDIPIKFEV